MDLDRGKAELRTGRLPLFRLLREEEEGELGNLVDLMPGLVGDCALLLVGGFSIREGLCVRSCCFMLSLRVNALLQVGQWMFFSPVCFLPWRAAWPDVVKVSRHAYLAA